MPYLARRCARQFAYSSPSRMGSIRSKDIHAVGDVHGADGGDGLAHHAFVHIHAYHRRVHVHGGPLGDARHRGDEEAALQNERLGVAASRAASKDARTGTLQELLGLQVAFLGQGLDFALEVSITSHHVSTSKYILNSFSTPSALHIVREAESALPFEITRDRVADELGVRSFGNSLRNEVGYGPFGAIGFHSTPSWGLCLNDAELVELGRETVDFRIGILLGKATRVVAVWDGDIDCGGNSVGKAGEV